MHVALDNAVLLLGIGTDSISLTPCDERFEISQRGEVLLDLLMASTCCPVIKLLAYLWSMKRTNIGSHLVTKY